MESGVPKPFRCLPLTWVGEELFLIHDLAIVSSHTAQGTLQIEVQFLLQSAVLVGYCTSVSH